MAFRSTVIGNFKFSVRLYSKIAIQRQYKRCYEILGISEDSDQESIRTAYLALVKKYHPDSGIEHANAEKFHEIDEAFRTLIEKKSKERWNVEDKPAEEQQDIKHTAPQHRQYLSYDGIGFGTPSQRQKQYRQIRAIQAADNVMQHRITKITAEEKALWDKSATQYKHKIKTKYGLDRLVEDLIQESMSKGEFDNLPGSGKPLNKLANINPYLDFTTHKINEVLIENGFTPEWISLNKEIREEIEMLRKGLSIERKYFSSYPLNEEDGQLWCTVVQKYEKVVEQINKKINKFNLVVPILNKQVLQVSLQKESEKILINGECGSRTNYREIMKKSEDRTNVNQGSSLFNMFSSIFKFE